MMKDPAAAEALKKQAAAYQEAMKSPEVQQEMQAMSAFLSNPALKEKLAGMKDDPEFADFFAALQKEGPAAMARFWNDEAFLAKIGKRLAGAVPPPPGAARPPPPSPGAAQQPPEEVTNLWEAARWGDLEAVEDFLAVGKDVNQGDKEGRRPLHFAVAFGRGEVGVQVVEALLSAKGLDLNATDVKKNTALHYAAGYGRGEYVTLLLDAGADGKLQNDTGKTAADLARISPQNPLSKDAGLLARLDKAAGGFFKDV